MTRDTVSILTRDKFCMIAEDGLYLGLTKQEAATLKAHDAEQRQQIATLREALKGIVKNIDEMSDRSLLLVQIRSFAKQALKEVK